MEKLFLSLKVIVIGLLLSMTIESIACTYTFKLYDSYGDGWNGGYINIKVNGLVVASNITLSSGSGPYNYSISVNHGDVISTDYYAGGWSYENYYEVFDNDNNFVVRDGCVNGSCSPTGGLMATANCALRDVAMRRMLTPITSCALSSAETVKVRIRNTAIQQIDTLFLSFSCPDLGGTWYRDTLYQTLYGGDSLDYTFGTPLNLSTPGTYTIILVATTSNDQGPSNDTLMAEVINSPYITTFPYLEGFESGSGGWYDQGTNSSWELGVPNGPVIDSAASDSTAWATNLSGPHNLNEGSWVISPCFDFTGLTNPVFEMKIWHHTIWDDGAAVQYTTDGINWTTLGNYMDPTNWYNGDWVYGLWLSFQTNPGWHENSNGWVTVRHFLPAQLAGAPYVRFRIIFGSTGYSYGGYDGIAFDDVHIFQPPPMTYDSSTALQPNTNVVGKGMKMQDILGIHIVTNSSTSPLPVTDIRFNTTGTTLTSDIDTARVYYSSDMNNWVQFGQDVKPLSPFGFQGNIALAEGDNYFWLVYDVSANATSGNFLDAEVDSILVGGVWVVPSNKNPLGNRQILPPMHGTYVVNQLGGADFTSLSDAANHLSLRGVDSSVVINMMPGIYNEKPEFRNVFGSSSINTITIKSSLNDSTSVTIQDSTEFWEDNWVILFDDASNYILKHLHIKPLSPNYARAIMFTGNCSDIMIENCFLEGASNVQQSDTWLAIVFGEEPTNHITIRNNRFLNGAYGVALFSWQNFSYDNLIADNIFDNQYGYGISLEVQKRPVIYKNLFNGSQNTDYYGIYGYNLTDSFRIMSNRILLFNEGRGVYLYDCYGDTNYYGAVVNNFVSVQAMGNGTPSGIYVYFMQNAVIMHNSVHIYNAASPNSYSMFIGGNNQDLYLINNIFSNATGGGTIRLNNPGGVWGDHNNYYYTGAIFGSYNYNQINTLQNWQQQSGFDANSQVANPMFVSNTDLHTMSLALANKGMGGTGLLVDIDGEPRDSLHPDIGAVEFPDPLQEASFEEFLSPVGDCGLGMENVIIRIANNGINAITGNLVASYQIQGGSVVNQSVPGTILPGDTLDFTFATQANLTVAASDSNFIIKGWITLVGDPIQYNDSGETQVWSGFVPPTPTAVNATVNYGNTAVLSATGIGTMKWYQNLLDSLSIHTGSSYMTPPLYDTTTYYVESWGALPSQGGVNVALAAVAAHSSGGSSAYSAANYNDNIISAYYANTPWGWVNNGAWIEYTWPAPVTFNSVKFYKADRPMYTCIFEYWDGIQYIPFYYYNNTSIDDSVGFPEITTSKLRFNQIDGSNSPNFREIQVFAPQVSGCPSIRIPVTANVVAFPATDAGITQITEPAIQAASGVNHQVTVMLKNYGTNALTNVNIGWSINNIVQTPYLWTGSLPHGSTVLVTIANTSFAPGNNCIKAWTNLPNGVPDNFNANDTSLGCFNACMSGTYTIGPASTGTYNFNTFTAAVNTMVAGGVCGPVIFDVYPGTYTEQVTIPAIPGAGPGSSITFRGATPDSTLAILQFSATSSGANFTLRFNGASWITLQHLTIKANGTTYGRVVDFNGSITNIQVAQCYLKTNTTSTGSTYACFYSPSNATSKYTTLINNRLEGGFYGIYWYGASSARNKHLVIANNYLFDFYRAGIYLYYTDSFNIEANWVINRPTAQSMYSIYSSYSQGTGEIVRNRIIASSNSTFYGIYLYNNDASQISTPFLVANNYLTYQGNPSGSAYGIYSYYNYYLDILYNSVRIGGGSSWDGTAYYQDYGGNNIRSMNNIFSNFNGGYAMFAPSTYMITQSNFNDYYTTGGNLVYWDYDHATFAGFQSYRASQGFETMSQNILPPFTNTINLDLNNTNLSGLASPQGNVTNDIFGHPRTNTPTIGAHEIPLIPNDAGVYVFNTPTPATVTTEGDPVPVEVGIKNYGLDPITSVLVSYSVNNGTPVSVTYTGYLSPQQTAVVQLPAYISPAGTTQVCAWTSLGNDINTFNDTNCISYYAFSNIDAQMNAILPLQEGCGPGMDTLRVEITNVATAILPAGYTASYRRGTDPVVTETVNIAIPVGDTIVYTFNTLINLNTSSDTIYTITAWVDALDDNIPGNDTTTSQVISLAVPAPPAVTTPVTITFGSSAILDANTSLYTQWYNHPTNQHIATGGVYQTPLLYDTTTYYAESFFGNYAQNFNIGTGTTQNSSNGYPNPYGHYYWGNKEQYLILASELSTAGVLPGDISSLGFNVITQGSLALQNFTIKLGHTTQTAMNSIFITGLTQVYTTPSYQHFSGWNTHTFQTPFTWDGTSNLVIEVCFNNNSYTSHGIVSLDQPGFVSTINAHNDASTVCSYTSGTTYSLRPVMKMQCSSIGCGSGRVPVFVNVTNIPPLGKPDVIPASMQVPLTGCNASDTRNIRIKNIGNAALQYTTFGGPHAKDTTSTKYFNASTYPDTTTHLFTSLPPSIDSLYLEITLNGYYSTSAAYASLIIEGANLGVIPDGDISYGVDITRQFAFGGTQLANWLSDGELKVRIGNSPVVYPSYGTRMHKVRIFTKPAPWATMNQLIGSVPVGDSVIIPVHFSAAGLTEGSYYASIPILFNHPGYPFVKIPVHMTVDGEPDIQAPACINFVPIFQYDVITDSVMIHNTGCAPLVISNISNTNNAFTPEWTQDTIPPFDSLKLRVSFAPTLQQTYLDTLIIQSNDNDLYICLNGVGLSPPIITLSTDTLSMLIIGCNDTLAIPLTISNLGNADLTWQVTSGVDLNDQFDNGINTSLWQSTTGVPSSSCGSVSAPNALYFNTSGTREAVTKTFNLTAGGNIDFTLKIASGSSPCESADYGEDVKLQFSTDGGITWSDIDTYYTGNFNSFNPVSVQIPMAARTNSTQLRWWQVSHSGSGYDNWAIDNVSIGTGTGFITYLPDTGTIGSLGQQTIQVIANAQGLNSGVYSGIITFFSNDPQTPVKLLPFNLTLIGAPDLNLQPVTCLTLDTTLKGGSTTSTFMVFNDGCDTLDVTSLATATPHFSVLTPNLQLNPFSSTLVTVVFHPQSSGVFQDSVTLISNDGTHKMCLTGVGQPAPEFVLGQSSITTTITNCNDSLVIPFNILNPGQADLSWSVGSITGSTGLIGVSSQLKVGVYNSPQITNVLNSSTDITATNIGSLDLNTISQYDVIMNIRGSNVNQNDVMAYIQAGGSWVGEWTSNYHPFQWGAITGNVSANGNGGTTGATILQPSHYLATHINWASIPYGAGPTDYMLDLRNLNDPAAIVIATANHLNYPNNPLLVEKRFGLGKIILFNWDYNDAPTYNSVVSNMIVEVARYAGMKASWLSLNPSQGTVSPSGYGVVNVKFNALGINSGTYEAKVLINSNDPLKPSDTLFCTMHVIGAPDLRLSQVTGCIDYDTIIQGFNVNDTLWIYNDGCDTLHIYGSSNLYTQYTITPGSIDILPYDSAMVIVNFAPNAAQVFADTLSFTTNDGVHKVCLYGVGIEAPVISYNPLSFNHTFNSCNDSVVLPLTIFNTGIGDLRYTMSNLFGATYDQTSTGNYSTSGATTNHLFNNVPTTSDSMHVIVTINGDFDDGTEYASLSIEGTNIGIIPDNNAGNGNNIVHQYTFAGTQLQTWLADGLLNVAVVNSPAVDHWSGLVSMHKVQVIINGIPWIAVSQTADTVITGDSSVVMVTLKTAGLNNGTYQTQIKVLSNDPINQIILIPCTITINGAPSVSLSEPCLHFGSTMQYSSKQDTLIISNNGCSALIISSIYNTLAHYSLSTSYLILQPGQQQQLIVTFAPTAVGQFNDNITLVTNAGTYTVCLTGQGVDASILSVSPTAFNKTINVCNDTIQDILLVQNQGTGNLTYQVYGGRGLSGDSTVLVIRDNHPWGINLEQYLLAQFGIVADVITSSQIAAANFSNYDIVITAGDQSATYYNTLSAQAGKFNAFANSGGIVLYMLANYQVNTVTLAGNVNVVYGNGESQNNIADLTHPIVLGLTNPLTGSNANANYLAGLPANANIITRTMVSAQPTTAEYEIGSGLVIATGMLWEYHSGTSFNIATMLHRAFSYALSTIGTSPSWMSFAYTSDTIAGIGSANVTVKFNSTGIPNGVYNSNIIVYSNDPVSPQILVPCTLNVNGAAQLTTNGPCLIFDTVVQGGTTQASLKLYNTGCANLIVSSASSLSSEYLIGTTTFTIAPGDSFALPVTFTPLATGNRSSTMNINSNLGLTQVCLSGFCINPPVVGVSPGSFDIVINGCSDTITQTMTLTNTGAGQAIYKAFGLYGSDIDQTSTIPFVSNGASTTHTFSNLPLNIDTMILEVTLSGDFDQASEYASLSVNGTSIGQISDGDITAGVATTDYFGFGGAQLNNWLATGQIVVTVQNAATVDHWAGLTSFHRVRLKINGNQWITLSSYSDTIPSNDSAVITVKFFSTNMNVGTHYYNIIIGSNDPGNALVSVPCTLTVFGNASWTIAQNCLNFDSIMIGTSNIKYLAISNTGCDTLKVSSILSDLPAILPAFTAADIMPGVTLQVPVTFTPLQSGTYTGNLSILSNVGQATVCLNAKGLPSPSILVPQTTLISNLACALTEIKPFKIYNTGQAPLLFNINPTTSLFLTASAWSGQVAAGDSATILFTFNKAGLQIGSYGANFTLTSNDPLIPMMQLSFTLEIPNMVIPVNLGPDQQVCANVQVVLNAGGNYTTYLWDNSTTDSLRNVASSGTYFVSVTDANGCPSSDTVAITFYAVPMVDAGADTSVCTGTDIDRDALVTGTIQVSGITQIGATNIYSGLNSITPFATNYPASRRQIMYRNTEMASNGFNRGLIQSVAFNLGSVGDPPLTDFYIKIGTTVQANLSNGFIDNLTQVYYASNQVLTTGWNTFTLNTPFFYNGMDNLLIELCFTNSTGNYNSSVQYHNAGFNAHRYQNTFTQGVPGCSLTGGLNSASRPNIRFEGIADQGIYTWTGPGGFSVTSPVLRRSELQPQHAGLYTLTVNNGIGCISNDAFILSLAPLPVVNAGADVSIFEGESIQLSGSVTGGLPPYNVNWSPGTSLNNPGVLTPIASPAATTSYELLATGTNGCYNTDSVKVTVIPRYNISGTLSYNNAAYTPMSNCMVFLKNTIGTVLDSVTTDLSGAFTFYLYPPGTYSLSARTDKVWGGVNATDALVVQRHVINLNPLTGIRIIGADVNNSATISSTDALMILRRTLGMDTTFAKGDWVYEQAALQISTSNVVKNFQTLATGDVNGSYVPFVMKQRPGVEMRQEGSVTAQAGLIEIPVKASQQDYLGAITLTMNQPESGVVIEDITSPLPGLMYNLHHGKLRIAWSDENGYLVQPGALLFTIKLRTNRIDFDEFWMNFGVESEIADINAMVIEPAILIAPKLASPGDALSNTLEVHNQPNPFRDQTTFICEIPEDGRLKIEVFDMPGKSLAIITEANISKGSHTFVFNSVNLPAGIYHYRVTLEAKTGTFRADHSMIITR